MYGLAGRGLGRGTGTGMGIGIGTGIGLGLGLNMNICEILLANVLPYVYIIFLIHLANDWQMIVK
jgi:hypothetical protein